MKASNTEDSDEVTYPISPGEQGYVPDRDWRRDGKECCANECADPPHFRCTREIGHEGDHIAHDAVGVMCNRWGRS